MEGRGGKRHPIKIVEARKNVKHTRTVCGSEMYIYVGESRRSACLITSTHAAAAMQRVAQSRTRRANSYMNLFKICAPIMKITSSCFVYIWLSRDLLIVSEP